MPVRRGCVLVGSVALVLALLGCTSSGDTGPDAASGVGNPPARPSAGCSSVDTVPASGRDLTFDSGGETRRYDLTVPSAGHEAPLPLVVNLHGAGGTAAAQDEGTRFAELAEEQGFVVLTPQATGEARWWGLREGSPDLPFIGALVDQTLDELCIDQSRIYAAGFSLGGMTAMALACADPARYAAIAVVAGLRDTSCEGRPPVPMIAFQGSDDPTIRADGSYPEGIDLVLGSGGPTRREIARRWSVQNGCAPTPPAIRTEGLVTDVEFSCPPGAEVRLVELEGGTHFWPGGIQDAFTPTTAAADAAVDATATIWSFFDGSDR